MTCENCLRPRATDADNAAYEAYLDALDMADTLDLWSVPLPDGWPDAEGNHLCWVEYGGECRPPEWWDSVTPAEVQSLRGGMAAVRAALRLLPTATPEQVAFNADCLWTDFHEQHHEHVQSWSKVVEERETARAELAEARAEIAAYQGRPEGALPGWDWQTPRWVYLVSGSPRKVDGRVLCTRLTVDVRTGVVALSVHADGGQRVETLYGGAGGGLTPRAGMRFGLDEARRRGWLP